MGFTNPVAWLGLVLLALPVAVHMLVRDRAPLQRLPTLRFLKGEPPVSIRRSRPDEPRLLLLRMAIVALAVAALARPYLPSAEAPDGSSLGTAAPPHRAVLLDESWSMLRPSDSAGSALARARELASEAAAEARASTVITFGADRPLEVALEGAAAWLEARPGPGEIVLVSDFQRGTLEAAGAVALPERLGLVPVAVEVDPGGGEGAAPLTLPVRGGTVQAAVEMIGGGGSGDGGGDGGPGAVRMTWSRAASAGPVASTPAPAAPAVEVIFPGATGDSIQTASATLSPTAASLLLRLASDRTLAAAAAEDRTSGTAEDRSPTTADDQPPLGAAPRLADARLILARDHTGLPLLTAGTTPSAGLRVNSRAPDGSLTAAALRVALDRATDATPPGEELEPLFDDADQRASWARPPGPGDADDAEPADSRAARWAWILVLVLLGAESLYRRRIHARRG